MTALDQDNDLKERYARVLFASGYACRYNVNVVSTNDRNDPEQGLMFTDVDVMGVRTDELLRTQIALGDCKSGKTGTPRERMFWLAGLKERFGAEAAFFVKQGVDPTPLLADFRGLGVGILSDETLGVLEQQLQCERFAKHGPVAQGSVVEWDRGVRRIKDDNRPAYRYLTYAYWADRPGTQLDALLHIINDLSKPAHRFARLSALSLLASSALALLGTVALVPQRRRVEAVLAATAGERDLVEQTRLLDTIHAFVTDEMKQVAGVKWKVGKETFRTFLSAPYAPVLGDLLDRLQRNPAARVLPRAIDVWNFTPSGKPDLSAFVSPQVRQEGVQQALGDLLAFAERAGGISPDDRKALAASL